MCGSGTLLIEAALIAADHAPGLSRDYYGFLGWRGHDGALGSALLQEARQCSRIGAEPSCLIRASDRDCASHRYGAPQRGACWSGTMGRARGKSSVGRGACGRCWTPGNQSALRRAAAGSSRGSRHPPATRPGAARALSGLVRDHSQRLPGAGHGVGIARFPDLQAVERRAGMPAAADQHRCRERACAGDSGKAGQHGEGFRRSADVRQPHRQEPAQSEELGETRSISCYRLYDADMPEYAFAIDLYRTLDPELTYLYVQEYAAPPEIEADAVRRRRREALDTLPDLLGFPPSKFASAPAAVGVTAHSIQTPAIRRSFTSWRRTVCGSGSTCEDYLDTGLFLDHRLTRARLRDLRPASAFSTFSLTPAPRPCTPPPGAQQRRCQWISPGPIWTGRGPTWS